MAKILIVDDERLTVEMLSMFMKLIGHEPIPALNVKQAWDKLAYEDPTGMLLDIMLPDGNGLEMCKDLRAKAQTEKLPIIIISAHAPPLIDDANKAGANAYLAKPIKLDKLKETLAQVGIV